METPAKSHLQLMRDSSALFGMNSVFIEGWYEEYLADPAAVPAEWRTWFDALAGNAAQEVAHGPIRRAFAALPADRGCGTLLREAGQERKQVRVLQLVNAYRFLGVRIASLDPLNRYPNELAPELDPSYYDLTAADMDTLFETGLQLDAKLMSLREIIELLRQIYCGSIGAEYMYLSDVSQRQWIQSRLESVRGQANFDRVTQRHILERLTAAETLERYLHTRYVGQKRFSLEGGETLIPLLDHVLQRAGRLGVQETVIGMAHRGRLNVLVNLLGKQPRMLFAEFEGIPVGHLTSGDVKYHQGFSADVETCGRIMHVELAFNPSHLEIVDPVVEGSVRSRQHGLKDSEGQKVLPILIHGDAAFSGQGVVMETLAMSQTRGYGTGGTLHIIVNNQIGYTVSDPLDMRSSTYCSDVAKMVEAPIFHVNADDPEAVLLAGEIALDYRMQYRKDVVIDLVCFRKLGHNEQDEPLVTQPFMYRYIKSHPGARALYARRLTEDGVIHPDEANEMIAAYRSALVEGRDTSTTSDFSNPPKPSPVREGEALRSPPESGQAGNPRSGCSHKGEVRSIRPPTDWSAFKDDTPWNVAVNTAVPLERLQQLALPLTTAPDNFALHARVQKVLEDRGAMARGELPLDWGMAESLAYASLLTEGYPVRLSGQDSQRGTFFHRHATWHDQNRTERHAGAYTPLQHLAAGQADFEVIDSLLSEEAVLAFEYGYATADPHTLVLWEAQFGDFANGAQVVIDQFIASGEVKWGRMCGLVMLLPHGYEGQGAEHSSARIERYLQLCADYNIQVCVPSTAAQMFHLLRRQMLRPLRKPLIVFTPKSLLRSKDAASTLGEFTQGKFHPVLAETDTLDNKKVRRIIACSGKVYYDLLAARRAMEIPDTSQRLLSPEGVVIIRIEQLYPFPHADFTAQIAEYPNATELVWCQEEPGNQGAWHRIQHYLLRHLRKGMRLDYALRPSSAAPAAGYLAVHQEQQKAVIAAAFRADLDEKK